MAKNLVIVESPSKAKTIEKYLGQAYKVKSSLGHIRDLPKKGLSIDIARNFSPTYAVPEDKKKVINELKKEIKQTDKVLLATDEDREGEAIAWHLSVVLDLPKDKTRRIAFHEITKSAIEEAIKKPRDIDQNLVNAQQARRVLDRLVGYELSPVLWKKVKPGLSAGRVQSVAVRLIVEREQEINDFKPTESYKLTAEFLTKHTIFTAELDKRFNTKSEARSFLEACKTTAFTVKTIEQKPAKKEPAAPFTTSTLQQEAVQKLGYSVSQTMLLAQRLYEAGHITYMRTDSVTLSDIAIHQAKAVIEAKYGIDYSASRQYESKSRLAQEAHEAIRPTDLAKEQVRAEVKAQRLYTLIYKRALSSQMSAANINRTIVEIAISKRRELFRAKGEIITFPGFLKLYTPSQEQDKTLPILEQGQKLAASSITATQQFSRALPRYNEASLVKKLETLGIGRPSTYAPTISTIQRRGYVDKKDSEGIKRKVEVLTLKSGHIKESSVEENVNVEKSKLIPTPIGKIVNDFLVKHFKNTVDYNFTARVEDDLDEIARGKSIWYKMIKNFYEPFHKKVESSEKITRKEATQARKLGIDPTTKRPVFVRIGRYGPMIQVGEAEDEEKPVFAPVPPSTNIDEITLKDAQSFLKLPRIVTKNSSGQEIIASYGPYGPYLKEGFLYASLKDEDPLTISAQKAKAIIKAKKQQEVKKHIKQFDNSTIQILNGPYGPYVTNGKVNVKVPKEKDPKELTLKQCEALIANYKNVTKR